MDIVICGRNVEVPEHFRDHVEEKLARLGRYDHKIVRMDVELSHEPNPRRVKTCQRVQVTGRGRGPVVRAEGCAADFPGAVDQAVARLEARLRRSHDRRRVHHGRRQPISVARATAEPSATADLPATAVSTVAASGAAAALVDVPERVDATVGPTTAVPGARSPLDDTGAGGTWEDGAPDHRADRWADDPAVDDGAPGRIVRRKEHHAIPMSTDDALSRMELVGHDFFLFCDAATGRPSVVYRRHGYDYGVITLSTV